MKVCGVCHSDIHLWRGGFDLGGGRWLSIHERGMKLLFVLGHEPVGEVVALGPEASGVSIGDTRLVFPWIGCGACNRCLEGNDTDCVNMRTIGVFSPGGYAGLDGAGPVLVPFHDDQLLKFGQRILPF